MDDKKDHQHIATVKVGDREESFNLESFTSKEEAINLVMGILTKAQRSDLITISMRCTMHGEMGEGTISPNEAAEMDFTNPKECAHLAGAILDLIGEIAEAFMFSRLSEAFGGRLIIIQL